MELQNPSANVINKNGGNHGCGRGKFNHEENAVKVAITLAFLVMNILLAITCMFTRFVDFQLFVLPTSKDLQ